MTREKLFWNRMSQPREYNRKAECISNIEKELKRLEEGTNAKIHLDSLGATLKKSPNRKTPVNDGIYGYWFKKLTSIHDRLAIKMNRCLQETDIPQWMTKGKTIMIQKDTQKKQQPPKTTDP